MNWNRTFFLPELVDGFKTSAVIVFVGVERGSEEWTVGDDFGRRFLRAAVSRHLPGYESHVEVWKFDVVTFRVRLTAARIHTPSSKFYHLTHEIFLWFLGYICFSAMHMKTLWRRATKFGAVTKHGQRRFKGRHADQCNGPGALRGEL